MSRRKAGGISGSTPARARPVPGILGRSFSVDGKDSDVTGDAEWLTVSPGPYLPKTRFGRNRLTWGT
jgi:hypothetical protein